MVPSPERLLGHIRRLVTRPVADPVADAVLLGRFVAQRDEAAFAALVARHGRMVFGVCRRVLRDTHAADDAAQATFMVLARKAAAIQRRDGLAGWLHGVARRVALKAKVARGRRRLHETQALAPAPPDPHPDPLTELSVRELLGILDEEIQRLPVAYRLPVILCCLEGRTQEEVARQLGWTAGSVKGRLERGRARLHERLARLGLTLSAALAAGEVSKGVASAGVPAASLASIVRERWRLRRRTRWVREESPWKRLRWPGRW
ncbi:MAG TPA: sigma-70 family RNA polymerase sigma factor [Gemmataceae bacterium]|jgi:RNA polymerase sigma factor (sigma-70 family)|nr:sigma-70 family RNA polymerase sigma factor [Gemmataceae bacterium]